MRRRLLFLAAVAAFVLCFPVADGAADLTAPTITGSAPASPANENSPHLSGTAVPRATVRVFTDNACAGTSAGKADADALGKFSVGVSVPDNSKTTFYASATDATGTSGCSSGFTYVEDSKAPPAPNVAPADKFLTNDSTPTFTFTDGEAGVTFNCRLVRDGSPPGAFRGCSSPVTPTNPLVDGSYTFYVKATDAASNESGSTSVSFTVDTKPPPQPTITGPATPTSSTTAHFEFSDGEPVSYACSLDNATFAACSNPVDFEVGDGAHTLVVEARDGAGNVSTPSNRWSWTVDTDHPLVTVNSKPAAVTNQTLATFTFSAAGTSRYQCSLDGLDFSLCTSPRAYPALPDGSHTFAVRALSAGGTPGAPTRYTWVVDTLPPKTTIASGPPSASNSASATFAFTSSEDASTFTCRLDGAGFVPCTSPETYAGLGDGDHTFSVEAVDQAGNVDTSAASYSWHISGVGPSTQDLKPPANVTRLRRNVGYGRFQLRWLKPRDADYDHIGVYVSTSPKAPPRTLVYSGKSQSYTDRHFKNGQYYRYLIVSYDHAKNASGGTAALVPPSALMIAPRNGAVFTKVPTFRWSPVQGAAFYNIQLYTHGDKVLSMWPGKARQPVSRSWRYRGHRYSLRPGIYVWYVWPGFGPKTKSRYGQLLGYASFRVR